MDQIPSEPNAVANVLRACLQGYIRSQGDPQRLKSRILRQGVKTFNATSADVREPADGMVRTPPYSPSAVGHRTSGSLPYAVSFPSVNWLEFDVIRIPAGNLRLGRRVTLLYMAGAVWTLTCSISN